MIYTVPWCPDVDEEIPSYVMHLLLQIESASTHVDEPVEVGFFVRCIRRDTGLSETTAIAMVSLAFSLGMIGLGTAELRT